MIATKHLRDLRLQKNLTQEYLAFELNISQKTYSNLENGVSKLTLEILQKIAEIYEMNVVELVTKLFVSNKEVIEEIISEDINNSKIVELENVNHDLPMELLTIYKERIADLKKIIEMKDERIENLKKQIDRF